MSALVKACAIEREVGALEGSLRLDFPRESGRFEARDAYARMWIRAPS